MRFFLSLALAFFSQAALADLYRWVDPESGSVKFSSYPPPWYGDPQLEKRSPRVERIPEAAPAAAGEAKAPPGSERESLEARRRALMQELSTVSARSDFDRGGAGFKRQLEAYQALTVELDRLDPKGADRRRAEGQALLENLLRGR
jgi:hypothetical protein